MHSFVCQLSFFLTFFLHQNALFHRSKCFCMLFFSVYFVQHERRQMKFYTFFYTKKNCICCRFPKIGYLIRLLRKLKLKMSNFEWNHVKNAQIHIFFNENVAEMFSKLQMKKKTYKICIFQWIHFYSSLNPSSLLTLFLIGQMNEALTPLPIQFCCYFGALHGFLFIFEAYKFINTESTRASGN